VVGDFLKSKNVASSGTWDVLLNKRIIPAVENHVITNEELIELLRASEECGHQHVFLYKARKGVDPIALMDRQRIKAAATKQGVADLIEAPRILDQPVKPTFADIRWDAAKVDLSMTIKEVYGHEGRDFSHEVRDPQANTVTRVYVLKKERAVNVARLDRDGNLEIRLSARSTGSTKYGDDLQAFWGRINPFLSLGDFAPIPLAKAKLRLVTDRDKLKARIRFSNSKLRNGNGTTMNVASGNDDVDDLYDDDGAGQGSAAFLAVDGGYCEGSNFHFKQGAELSRDVHVIMAGQPHEFALTADCTSEDYQYVLGEVRTLNK
jgi:hypothetical protein